MATNKYAAMALAARTTELITQNGTNWKSFLRASARHYKYPYQDQLMIYAQKPDATACASYELWDEQMDRYVKHGTSGIALFDTRGDRLRLRYVFDVSDTGERSSSRSVGLFSMRPEYREAIQRQLTDAFSIREEESLEKTILRAAVTLAREYWREHRTDILNDICDGFAEGADEKTVGQTFTVILAQSIAYSLMSRCSDEPDAYIDQDILDLVSHFNNENATSILGTAVSGVTTRVFMEIILAVREYEREKRKEMERNEATLEKIEERETSRDIRAIGNRERAGDREHDSSESRESRDREGAEQFSDNEGEQSVGREQDRERGTGNPVTFQGSDSATAASMQEQEMIPTMRWM